MAWVRGGDTSATYPPLMSVAGFADEESTVLDPTDLVNLMMGWIFRCATQSGAHLTDYRVDIGTVMMLGGARTPQLIRLALRTGLVTEKREAGQRFLVIRQDADFLHLRLKAEVERERQHRNDTRDPLLKAPVLLRDGDECRYCGHVVHWPGRVSKRKGTLDHLEPDDLKPGVDGLVVACWSCNGARQEDLDSWDVPLRPVPAEPVYSEWSADYLTRNGHPTVSNIGDQRRGKGSASGARGSAAALADSPAAGSAEPLAAPQDAPAVRSDEVGGARQSAALPASEDAARGAAPGDAPGVESGIDSPVNPDSVRSPAPSNLDLPGRVGSGRVESGGDGSGGDGSGRDEAGTARAGDGSGRRRRRRGGRGRGRGRAGDHG